MTEAAFMSSLKRSTNETDSSIVRRIDVDTHVANIESIYDLGHIASTELGDTEPFTCTQKHQCIVSNLGVEVIQR